MNKLLVALVAAILMAPGLLAACAPATAPPPAPAPAAPAPKAAPATSPEEAAWAQVVEAAKKEGKFTAYSFSFIGDIGLGLQAAFKERFGISMEVITGRGAEFTERVKTEQRMGKIVGDLFEGSSTHGTNIKVAGGTANSANIAVLREREAWQLDPVSIDSEAHLLGHRRVSLIPFVNTNLVKPGQEPKSWKELVEPRWKGKMVTTDPNVSVSNYNIFITLQDRNLLAPEIIKALGKQDLRFVPGNRDAAAALARGEFSLGWAPTEADSYPFLKEGAPMQAVSLAEGTVTTLSVVSVIKNSPYPNAARLFANWILSREGQAFYCKLSGLASVRKDVEDFRHPRAQVVGKLVLLTEDDVVKSARLFREKYFVELWKN